jgi:hypothetical protein
MELKCRNCGAPIPAENINIQEMLAVCPACNHVFEFDRGAVARKTKHRIPKRPARLHVYEEDDQLELSYRLVFGAGPTFGLVMCSIGAVVSSILFVGAIRGGEPPGPVLLIGALACVLGYMLAVFVSTTTQIIADEDSLEVISGPIPFPNSDDKRLNSHEIARVYAEPSMTSWADHHVYAELHDSSRITLVTSLPYAHAHYIALMLQNYLHSADEEYEDEEAADMIDSDAESADDSPAAVPTYRERRSG